MVPLLTEEILATGLSVNVRFKTEAAYPPSPKRTGFLIAPNVPRTHEELILMRFPGRRGSFLTTVVNPIHHYIQPLRFP